MICRIINKFWLTPLLGLLFCTHAYGITVSSFGTNGAGGFANGQTISIGSDGSVFELDAFVNIDGPDLNGAFPGSSAQLGFNDPLPTGLDFSFNSALSDGNTDLELNYIFTNNTGADISNFTFLAYLDAEIGAVQNDFATTSGSLDTVQNFQVNSPTTIFSSLLFDVLSDTNIYTGASVTGDVAMGLSWDIDTLFANDIVSFNLLISEDGDSLGSFLISQFDEDAPTSAIITYSGDFQVSSVSIPEPGTLPLLMISGLLALVVRLRRPSFVVSKSHS